MATRARIHAFFKDTLHEEPPDEDIVSYIESCLTEGTAEDMVDTLSALIDAYSPSFAAHDEETKSLLLLALHEQAEAAGSAAVQELPAINELPQQASEALQQAQEPSNSPPHEAPLQHLQSKPPDGSPNGSAEQEDPESAVIDQLMELCIVSVSRDYLRHVLYKTGGPQEAADWILDTGEQLQSCEAAWEQAVTQAAAGQDEYTPFATDKQLKQRVLAKYDLQKVPTLPQGSKRQQQKQLASVQLNCWSAPQSGQNSKVRYRDGQAVSTKGEKYIMEKQEEYDGGSKGKVYTKGKRGKGFM